MNRIGSLCTGYGGLDLAVENVLGGELVWYSEFDKHPSALLQKRFPQIPNLGDLTTIEWSGVEPIDILTGGYPCQPFSNMGKKLGEDDERHLWPYIREAIRVLRPRVTVLENVAAHLVRGFPTVLRDCAEDGLSVRWVVVGASEAGAPHRRDRLFFVVTDPDSSGCQGHCLQPERLVSSGERSGVADGVSNFSWGDYGTAIKQWEGILGRKAPYPVEDNANGRPRPTSKFYEWMMGLPEGWVTDAGLPYGAQIKLLGNGVVPQQAELALRLLLDTGQLR